MTNTYYYGLQTRGETWSLSNSNLPFGYIDSMVGIGPSVYASKEGQLFRATFPEGKWTETGKGQCGQVL
jgi:hypothetical protein